MNNEFKNRKVSERFRTRYNKKTSTEIAEVLIFYSVWVLFFRIRKGF